LNDTSAGNRIASLQSLDPLKALTTLHSLDLAGNPVAEMPEYRAHVFEELPSLTSVDEMNKNGEGRGGGPSAEPGQLVVA
jgi:Leucine-rich repeat (LRR) protein